MSPMSYAPHVESFNRIGAVPLGAGHTALLFDQIQSAGSIEYAFIVAVFDDATEEPVLFVASEVNAMKDQFGGGSHFLGLFPGDGHANLGDSDDWADPSKFFPEAVSIAARHLGVPVPPEFAARNRRAESPPARRAPWWQFWRR